MNLLFYVLFGIFIFCCVLIGGRRYRSTALYALAIGGVVNTCFFTELTHPINIFGYTFGMDSIIYSLFVFCVILMYFQSGKKQAYLLTISSLIAIMVYAVIDTVTNLLFKGLTDGSFDNLIKLTFSVLASIISMAAVLETIDKVYPKYKNQYVLTIVGLLISIAITTPVYLLTRLVISRNSEINPWEITITSMIGKTLSIGFASLSLFLVNLYDKLVKPSKK